MIKLLILAIAFLLMALPTLLRPQEVDLPPDRVPPYAKALVTWDWAQGEKPPATGFRVLCGPESNSFTEVEDIPDVTARSYLIAGMVSNLLTHYGKPVGNFDNALRVWCFVLAVNAVGDSMDGPEGSPAQPTNIRIVATPFAPELQVEN